MSILHLVLAVGLLVYGVLALAVRPVERFIGWRYLFQRRTSRRVSVATAVLGTATLLLHGLYLLWPWRAGSVTQGAVVVLGAVLLLAFTVTIFLNLFSVFTTISMTGVCFGVATLIVVLSVTSGFQQEFQRKVLGINAHVLIMKYGIDFSEYRDIIKTTQAVPGVRAAAPFVFNEMLIARGPSVSGVIVKGILPGASEQVLDIGQMDAGSIAALNDERVPREGGSKMPGILLGRELGRKLKAGVGDVVRIIAPLADADASLWSPGGAAPKTREFRVAGIFYSGFDEYDRRLVLIHLRSGQAFQSQNDVVTGVELKTDDVERSAQVAARIDEILNTGKDGARTGPYRVIHWRELNHNLFTALALQKVVLVIVLTLIVLVAAFGIVATLTMLVIDKTREIAILKSVGMRHWAVARVFHAAGLTIGFLGTAAGIGVGLVLCVFVSRYQYRLDPRVYLIDRLPVAVSAAEVLLIALITLGICFLATVYPALRAARLPPVDGLHYD